MINDFENKIEHAPALDFGSIFSESIELFKKVWVQGFITILLTMALMIPFYMVIYMPLLVLDIVNPEVFNAGVDANPILFIPIALCFLVFIIIAAAISLAMQAAFYRMCMQKDLGIASNDDYFYYLKKKYFLRLIKLALATVGISIVCAMLCVLPLIYAIVPLSFFVVVFAFNTEMSVTDIVKASFKIGNKKWLIAFALIFVCGILAEIVGLLMCFVGLFITASFSYLPIYFIYKHVVGFEDRVKTAPFKELEKEND